MTNENNPTANLPKWTEIKPELNKMRRLEVGALLRLMREAGVVTIEGNGRAARILGWYPNEITRAAHEAGHLVGLRDLYRHGWIEVVAGADGRQVAYASPKALAAWKHGNDWIRRRAYVLGQ